MSRKTVVYCDVCKKEFQPRSYGETGELQLTMVLCDDRPNEFIANYELCGVCFGKIKKAINEISPIKWDKQF